MDINILSHTEVGLKIPESTSSGFLYILEVTSKAVQFVVASSTITGLPEHPFTTDSTCITYDAVNAAYLDARKRIHISQPKGDWKTEDIATVGELLLDISIQLARTSNVFISANFKRSGSTSCGEGFIKRCHSHVFMIFNCHDCMNNTTSSSGSTSHVSMIQRFVVFSVIDDYSDDVCDVMRYTTQKLHDD
uniref:Uncharacterized protein n=1 Tax=Glossina palpalis gambiensis TaxID=67801 RepID=A0A1B0C0M8_9MUSC